MQKLIQSLFNTILAHSHDVLAPSIGTFAKLEVSEHLMLLSMQVVRTLLPVCGEKKALETLRL